MASLCPLGRDKDEKAEEHSHEPCKCMDDHDFDSTHTCLTCGVARCSYTEKMPRSVMHHRCTRMRGHGKRHVFGAGRKHDGPVKGS